MRTNIFLLLTTILVTKWISGIKVIPERATVEYLNPKFVANGSTVYIKRYGRKSPYYLNLNATILSEFNNNMTVNAVFYEYLNNEYKRSFIEWHYRFCDMMNKDPIIGQMVKNHGLVCPAPAGTHTLLNMTVPTENMQYVWPFEKFRVNISLTQTYTKEKLAYGVVYASLIQRKKGKK